MRNIKNSEFIHNEVKIKYNKNLKTNNNFEKLISSITSQPKTPSSNINSLPSTSNNIQFMKSPRPVEQKRPKKYTSSRENREKSKNYSQPKTK